MNTHNKPSYKKTPNDTPIMPPNLELSSTLIGSNYPCLELIFMVPKVFEPLKFYCSKHAFGIRIMEFCTSDINNMEFNALEIIICLRKSEVSVERILICNVIEKLAEHGIYHNAVIPITDL